MFWYRKKKKHSFNEELPILGIKGSVSDKDMTEINNLCK